MTNKLFIIALFSLVVISASAQKYGFYGRGAKRSYHRGLEGVYVGYDPSGIVHSRGRFVFMGIGDSRRNGRALPNNGASSSNHGDGAFPGFGLSSFGSRRMSDDGISWQGTDVRSDANFSNSSALHSGRKFNPLGGRNCNILGISSALTIGSASFHSTGSAGGSGAFNTQYARGLASFSGFSSAALYTTAAQSLRVANAETALPAEVDMDGKNPSGADEFLEPPTDDSTPLGDPILPLLLLLLPLVFLRFHRH